MVGTVDLYEFSEAVTAVARPVNPWFASGIRKPETVSDHPFPERFYRNGNIVALPEFFSGQRGAKITVVFV
ncbi:hypothetical protein B2J69_12140 [Pantoea latae]|uniref:Uncharacterized protein n=1 Tax=Pantoea latae TaxID=1964541 RepID=A0A1V9DHL1_9GAMM|nr:hypothetical protein B2J69_12140 [Pantoea latae]